MNVKKTNIRNIFILVILSILLNVKFVIAQNTVLQDLNNTFQNLNNNKLNTGILLNKVVSMSDIYIDIMAKKSQILCVATSTF